MSRNAEVAKRDEDAAAVAALDQAAAAVAARQEAEWQDEPLSTPILKIGQGLTREVQDGNAESGEFINSLTSESLGTKIGFIVAYFNSGRFAAEQKSGRSWVAFGRTIPEAWADYVGAEYVGTPFAEHPDAEEQFRAAVNSGEREWGSGPPISTTWNYTGLVLVPGDEEIGDEDRWEPVRLSLKRIDKPAHQKLQTLLRAVLRNKPPWDRVVEMATVGKDFGRNTAYTIQPTSIRFTRNTTTDERLQAAEVAQAAALGRTVAEGEGDALADKPAEPADNGGLAVG